MKFLLDQGLPRSLKLLLLENDYEAEYVANIDMSKSSDIEMIKFAKENGYVCITIDSDFHTIMALSGNQYPSVIRFRIEGLKAKGFLELLIKIIPEVYEQLQNGCLVSVQDEGIRYRNLPI